MKRKSLYKVLMATAASTVLVSNANAQTGVQYFMKYNPQQHVLNPAFQPKGTFYIGMPALSSLNFYAGNNDLVFTDIFQNITVDGKKQTVLFFDSKAKEGSVNDYLDALSDGTHIFYDHRINLIDFGFRAGKGYFTFNLTNRASVNSVVPKALSELAFKGIDEGETYNLSGKDLAADATLYTEVGVGYSRSINDKLDIGATFKFLYGHGNMRTNFKDLSITGNDEKWAITGNGSIEAAVPGIEITEKEDGQIDDVDFDDDIEASEFAKPAGKGFAVDLGASYKILPQLTVSASVLDLGLIHWSENIHKVKKVNDFVWDGIEYDINDDTTDYWDEYEDMADAMFRVDHEADSYTTWLNTKFMLGGEYSVWRDQLSFGLLGRGQLFRGNFYGNGLASVNFRPGRHFGATVTYGLFDGEWNNLGAGLNINAGAINMYLAAENIPFKFAKSESAMIPSNLQSFRLSMGMNLYFGYGAKREKKHQEEEEAKAKQTEEAILVENTENTKKEEAQEVVAKNNELAQNTAPEEVKPANVEPAKPAEEVKPATVQTEETNVQPQVAENVPQQEAVPQQTVAEPQQTAEVQPAVVAQQEEVKPAEPKTIPASLTALATKAVYGIQFAKGKDVMAIKPISYPILNQMAQQLKDNPDVNVTVKCHSYIIRDVDYTYFVTEEHANLVKGYLIEKGIDPSRITTVGMGADKPIMKGLSETARKKNERVEIKFE